MSGHTIEKGKLKGFVDRLVELDDQVDELKEDMGVVIEEAKQAGYAPRALRHLVKEIRTDEEGRAKIEGHEMTVAAYRHALGVFADTPLGKFAAAASGSGDESGDGAPAE